MSSVEQEEPTWSEQRVQEAVYLHSSCQVGESEDFFAVQGSAYLAMMLRARRGRRALGSRPATSRPPAGRTRHDLPEASTATSTATSTAASTAT